MNLLIRCSTGWSGEFSWQGRRPETTWERSLARIYFSISDHPLSSLEPLSMKEGATGQKVVGMFTRSSETRGVTRVRGLGLIPLSYILLLNLQPNQSTCLLAYRHSLPLGQSCWPLLRLEMRSHFFALKSPSFFLSLMLIRNNMFQGSCYHSELKKLAPYGGVR